jgi:hypothetical protein
LMTKSASKSAVCAPLRLRGSTVGANKVLSDVPFPESRKERVPWRPLPTAEDSCPINKKYHSPDRKPRSKRQKRLFAMQKAAFRGPGRTRSILSREKYADHQESDTPPTKSRVRLDFGRMGTFVLTRYELEKFPPFLCRARNEVSISTGTYLAAV